MKPISRILAFAVGVSGLVISSLASPEILGAQSKCVNSECLVGAGSSPITLTIGLALLVFLFVCRQHEYLADSQKVVGIFRRFGAFLLDFALVMAIAAPIGAIPSLLAEYHYTGTFRWSFVREFGRPTDVALILPVAIGVFVAMFLYFSLHPKKGRQTFGQYVLGYRVVAADGSIQPGYGKRALLSFIGLCAWPISVILALRTAQKAFWWDAASGTKVEHAGG